eukprot:CAMPEP_0171753802 /NCGR_PEP_ID=MMETSP0991-20121206/43440_1 /TAXON_ID=483369 /ORGANISM="non described non described, Strain CCMP2098" /LENGTH=56 /DNA_ID=CAMNT_0012355469 /DNA_START=76 /DNA_END=243 /DNA_ORIENTATION=+
MCLHGRVTVLAVAKQSRQMAHSFLSSSAGFGTTVGPAAAPAAPFVVRSAGVRQKRL